MLIKRIKQVNCVQSSLTPWVQVSSCFSYNVSANSGQCMSGVIILLLIIFEGRIKKSQFPYSEEQQTMDPKGQKLKLNDGHFIPVLGFGTYAPPEVTVLVAGWDINSSGCDMSRRDLGCQALSSCVTLGGSRGSINQARTISYERGESIQPSLCIMVWSCAHLQITLGFLPVSISFPAWQKRWDSAVKNTVSCFALKVISMVKFICIFN